MLSPLAAPILEIGNKNYLKSGSWRELKEQEAQLVETLINVTKPGGEDLIPLSKFTQIHSIQQKIEAYPNYGIKEFLIKFSKHRDKSIHVVALKKTTWFFESKALDKDEIEAIKDEDYMPASEAALQIFRILLDVPNAAIFLSSMEGRHRVQHLRLEQMDDGSAKLEIAVMKESGDGFNNGITQEVIIERVIDRDGNPGRPIYKTQALINFADSE